jgi:glutathione S-transferase
VHHIAFAVSKAIFDQAVERLEERGVRHSGVKDRGFMDSLYFEDPLGLLIELSSYRFEPPAGHTHADVLLEAHKMCRARRPQHRPGAPRGRDRDAGQAVPRIPIEQKRGEAMATNTLNILKPSVNNLTVRIFVRAAGLDYEEVDVWGQTTTPEYMAKYPAHLTPMLEEEGLPQGALGESCAIMAYLSNKHGLEQFYPSDPGRRAMIDNAMFYLIGTVYPLIARATYPVLAFPQYPGEVATSEAEEEMKEKARKDAEEALAEPLEVYNRFFLADKPFIGGDHPSIADIRLAATLEFLRAIDYDLPQWAEDFMARMEDNLGEAYSEPAADVRGYVASVKEAATA